MFRKKNKEEKKGFFRRKKTEKVVKEKRGFFRRKKSKNEENSENDNRHSGLENNINIDIDLIKERIKRELVREVSTDFIHTFKDSIKGELKSEIRNELRGEALIDKEGLTTKFFTTRVKKEIKDEIKREMREEIRNELKKEIRDELFESLKKDILLDIKISKMREMELRKKILMNNKKNNEKVENTNKENLKNIVINNENSDAKLKDEELIKNFLADSEASENEENIEAQSSKVHFTISNGNENTEDTNFVKLDVDKKTEKLEYTKTEFIEADESEYTMFDVNSLNVNEETEVEDFFSGEEIIDEVATDLEIGFKDFAIKFAREQGENIKKVGSDVKILSKKGYNLSKEEIIRIKNSEAYKSYVEKLKNIKKK